ncbi:fungal hydrophobin [Obba rivulosa]|uniref:Hydrophobin n=1 Tax=Obba rivulosa TaxID=1052685 RepID=A0A8E2ASE4_9APHY|nr:fungal hydrophobin [Obba rivulosa]
MKFALFAALATLATLAAAMPQTSSGSCCEQVGEASSQPIAGILNNLGVVIQDINAIVGVECSPITVVGVGSGSACSGTAVSCSSNELNGLVQIGCVPIST